MILIWAVVLGLLAALVRYGKHAFSHLASIPLRYVWLILLAVVLQIPLLRSPTGPLQIFRIQQALFLASFLLLLLFVWLNRHLFSVMVIGTGILLNLIVILSNGGYMPISPQTLTRINPDSQLEEWEVNTHYEYSKDAILEPDNTQLKLFSDIFIIPVPIPVRAAFSIGDLIIAIGIVLLFLDYQPSKFRLLNPD